MGRYPQPCAFWNNFSKPQISYSYSGFIKGKKFGQKRFGQILQFYKSSNHSFAPLIISNIPSPHPQLYPTNKIYPPAFVIFGNLAVEIVNLMAGMSCLPNPIKFSKSFIFSLFELSVWLFIVYTWKKR